MTRTLADIARVIRSKNAGPTILTIDLIFDDEEGFAAGRAALTAGIVAERYAVRETDVRVIPYPPALAVKITLPRRVSAGSPGDRDVYGAQQHGPLLTVPA